MGSGMDANELYETDPYADDPFNNDGPDTPPGRSPYDTDPYPRPVSDPASEGLPDTADPDSQAFDEVESVREADGLDPAALPGDVPLGLDEFGTTPAEQRRGESFEGRLARELPDFGADDVPLDPADRLAEEADPDAYDQLADDSEMLVDDDIVDPHLESHVSVFDRVIPGVPGGGHVGRLVQPDEGGYSDTDAEEYAEDAGAAGGGATAEELAVHEVADRDLDEPYDESQDVIDGTAGGPDEVRVARDSENAESGDVAGRGKPVIRTGAEQPWDPEDLAVAEGHDPTPANVERARRELEELGPAAIEKTVP